MVIVYALIIALACYLAYNLAVSFPAKIDGELTEDEYEWCIAREESNE